MKSSSAGAPIGMGADGGSVGASSSHRAARRIQRRRAVRARRLYALFGLSAIAVAFGATVAVLGAAR